jgi:3',5'-cyclic AMP phosphodiesterase CpdA
VTRIKRIAHLSDVHILDPKTRRSGARYRLATKLVSMGRVIDPRMRAKKLARALGAAKASGADHFVISGDLTELGDQTEFEHFAEVLEDARLPEDCVTIVPGNHDAYTSDGAWKRAIAGPLKRFGDASAGEPGKVVERGDVALIPIDTSCFQNIVRVGGEFTLAAARAVEARLADPALREKAIVLVLHHAPFVLHKTPVMQWIDGLRGCTQVIDLLRNHPRVQVLHGHLHRVVDRMLEVRESTRTRIFGAPAVCDASDAGEGHVRVYDVRNGALESLGMV